MKIRLCRYEADFYMNAVHGRGIISWAAVDTSRSDPYCDELIGFVTSRVISPSVGEVSPPFGDQQLFKIIEILDNFS